MAGDDAGDDVGEVGVRVDAVLTVLIEDESEARIPPVARHALRYLVEQLRAVKTKFARIDSNLVAVARGSSACRRLMTIPGWALSPRAPWFRPCVIRPTSNPAVIFPRGSDWCPSSIPRAARSSSARSANEGTAIAQVADSRQPFAHALARAHLDLAR
ncbi:hypothetical protein [Mesorhizobium sp. B2-5-9]|uniref:hypothetical protein n=1 Tax=Mesorhizobium sp. B2-5-9 TaxID=2589921 RepID=UPI001FEEF576|nr:hypothetical protein [Mesorhizobium sp. B2-5-9]